VHPATTTTAAMVNTRRVDRSAAVITTPEMTTSGAVAERDRVSRDSGNRGETPAATAQGPAQAGPTPLLDARDPCKRRIQEVDEMASVAFKRNNGPRPVDPSELRAVLAAAQHAPSLHNSQPWRFVLDRTGIEVHGDDERWLRHTDPARRELTISCGAAILNMRIAAAAIRRQLAVHLAPDAANPAHLATLSFSGRHSTELADAALSPAIELRHTYRHSFAARPIPEPELAALRQAALDERVSAEWVRNGLRPRLIRLATIAMFLLDSDPDYRRELRRWTTAQSGAPEGVPAPAFGTESLTGDPPLRDFTAAMPWIARPREVFPAESWLLLSTDGDDTAAWLRAGQATERVLLQATARGLVGGFITQIFEAPGVRREIAGHTPTAGLPQVVLRVGYPRPDDGRTASQAGRRPLDDMVRASRGVAELLLRRDADDD
jgi:nitroreductase